MANKFSLADVIGEVSNLDINGRKQLVYLPISKIDADPRNFYSTEGISELADNIQLFGLMDPLTVRPVEGERYQVVSGHRRRKALLSLILRGIFPPNYEAPCFIDDGLQRIAVADSDPDKAKQIREAAQHLQLIFANSDNRETSSAEKAREVKEIQDLLVKLRNLGVALPGKLRSHVAEAAHISESRVARLNVIENNLTGPQLVNAYRAGVIGESVAYEIARRSPEVRERAEEQVGFIGHQKLDVVTAMLDAFERDIREEQETAAKLREALDPPTAEEVSEARQQVDDYIETWQKENLQFLDMMGSCVDEFLQYFPTLIHSRREGIDAFKDKLGRRWTSTGGRAVNYSASPKGLELRSHAVGRITRTWTEAFDALCLAALNQRAKRPETSNAIYAAAAEPEPRGWETGIPEESGWYALKTQLSHFNVVFHRTLYFDASLLNWFSSERSDTPALDAQDNILGWYKLPEDG